MVILNPRVPAKHRWVTASLLAGICILSLNAAATELRIRFVYDGDPPAPQPIVADRDKEICGAFKLVDERLLVNRSNRGIQNVVVYLDTGRGGTKLAPIQPRNEEVQLTAEHCRFHPHIVVAQAGDTLVFEPQSAAGHNLNISFFRNPPTGIVIPPGGARRIKLSLPEPAPIPLECNIHPWMSGYLILLEHPFVGISDADGQIVISGLPNDRELVFRVFHESLKGWVSGVKVNGNDTTWQRNRFSITPADGVTNLGTVSLPAEVFAMSDDYP